MAMPTYQMIAWLGTILLTFWVQPLAAAPWQTLAPGLTYRELTLSPSEATLHLLKVELQHYRISLLHAASLSTQRALIEELVRGQNVTAAINASFFDASGQAMGLVIDNHQEKNPLRQTNWGIFQIVGGVPSLIHTRQFKPDRERELAIQTGPRLLVDGRISSFKESLPARRSAICILNRQEVIFAVVYPLALTLTEFAQALKPYCLNALNLDGGSSTQFYLKTGPLQKLLPGREPIPNALAVFAK